MALQHESLPVGLTQQQVRAWLDERPPDDLGHYELLGGRVVVSPPAGWPHARIGSRVVKLLANYVDSRRLGEVLDSSAGFDLPSGDTLEPDASFVSHARWAAAPTPAYGEFLKVVPDLVVETLSRSTRKRDLGEKKDVYARNGVDEYWVIDPVAGSVTVFSRMGDAFDAGVACTTGRIASRLFPDLDATVEQILDR
ncbi:MAG: Uma2 family endonuclease [Thermodesulfobacteriota bacterium]